MRRLCDARDLLAEAPDQVVSIDDLARSAGISPFHFIRQFAAVFGTTPHQFRIERRLEHARRLLARGEHSVTEVCMEVGFSSLGSFSALFTRRVGEAPSAYRRRARVLVRVPHAPATQVPGCFGLMCHVPAWAWARPAKS